MTSGEVKPVQQYIPHIQHRVWYSLHDCEIEIVGFYSKLLVMEYPRNHIYLIIIYSQIMKYGQQTFE